MGKKSVVALVLLGTALAFVQAQDVGRVEWSARARTDLQANFSPVETNDNGQEIDLPGVTFYEDNDAGAYGWNTMMELMLWYGKGQTSMWGIVRYRQGWGFESLYNLSYDNNRNGNAGGKVQIGTKSGVQDIAAKGGVDLFTINRVSLYGWWQTWYKRILIETNPFGATDEEYGSIWKTPAWLFDDHDKLGTYGIAGEEAAYFDGNLDTLLRVQFRNVVENLNFGLTLPHFGQLTNLTWGYYSKQVDGQAVYWDLKDVLLRASLGFRYSSFDYTFAGGFKMDPDKDQRAYLGGEYKVLDQRLGIRADVKYNHIGKAADNMSDLDIGEGVEFRDGPLNLLLTVYERNMLYDNSKQFELGIRAQAKYTIIGRRLLARARFYVDKGMGEDNNKSLNFEVEPGIFWAIGGQGVTDDLDNYSGMYARLNFQFGKDLAGEDFDERRFIVGFRWSM